MAGELSHNVGRTHCPQAATENQGREGRAATAGERVGEDSCCAYWPHMLLWQADPVSFACSCVDLVWGPFDSVRFLFIVYRLCRCSRGYEPVKTREKIARVGRPGLTACTKTRDRNHCVVTSATQQRQQQRFPFMRRPYVVVVGQNSAA